MKRPLGLSDPNRATATVVFAPSGTDIGAASDPRAVLTQPGCTEFTLMLVSLNADDGNLALRTKVRKALKGWKDFLAKIVRDGQSAGEINPEIDPHSVANLLISILEGATVVARINKRSAALDDAQRHLNLYLETVVRLAR